MAEMMEQTTQGKTVTRWWTGMINIQTVAMLGAAFVAVVIFWKDSKDNWNKTSRLENVVNTKASADELKALREQVNRQYQTQREKDNEQDRQVKQNADWIEWQKGFQAGQKK